jgi:signal transduction histidine kinase
MSENRQAVAMERLADIFDALPIGIALIAPDGALLHVNRQARALLAGGTAGASGEELGNRRLASLAQQRRDMGHLEDVEGLDVAVQTLEGDSQSPITLVTLQAPQVGGEELARVEERERIARDLHDAIVQPLIGIGISVDKAGDVSPSVTLAERLHGIAEEVDRVISDIRDYIFLLRPRLVGQRTFIEALRKLIREVEASTGMRVRLTLDRDLAGKLAAHASDLVKLIREALSNAARHGRARQCDISLSRSAEGVLLSIADDGVGFELAASLIGDGIANMRERADRLGGSLRIASIPGAQTTVELVLPAPAQVALVDA